MNAVLWGNGIGNFVLATPLFQNIDPVIYIPKADPRREAIESISPYPVRIFEHEKEWNRFDKVYQMWCAPKINGSNVVKQAKPKLNNWVYGHEIDYNLSLLPTYQRYEPKILSGGGLKLHPKVKLICVGNGANPAWKNKQLKESTLDDLIIRLKGYTVAFVGGKDEEVMGKRLEKKHGILNYAGAFSLHTTLGVLKNCHKFITTDSGLMHCADAIGVDVIALWGGTIWEKNRPSKGVRIQGNCPYAPCYGTPMMHECKDNVCMDIDINKVMEAL